jgi:hypothetical protein
VERPHPPLRSQLLGTDVSRPSFRAVAHRGPRSEKKARRIMRRFTVEILVISGVSLLALASIADAAGPTQADFDFCNREAHARAASPSAAPGMKSPATPSPAPTPRVDADIKSGGGPVSPSAAPAMKTPETPPAPQGDSAGVKPGTPVSPSAAPAMETPATPGPAPTTGAGARSSAAAPQAAPSPQTAGEARVANQADQLRGIADTSKDDPTYQQAYRDCMKGRGF